MSLIVLLLSLIMGLSFIIGLIISRKFKSKFLSYFATGLAFVILLALLFIDIIPEMAELSTVYVEVNMAFFGMLSGILLLVLLDLIIPHHEHEHKHNDDNKKEHKEHLYHIGMLTFISVLIHNTLEGIAFFLVGITSIKAAILMSLGIALHNIPLGIEISCFFDKGKKNNKYKELALVLSGSIGALIGLIIGDLNPVLNIAILSVTAGMIMYTAINELGSEVISDIKEKGVISGIITGVIISILLIFS